MNPFSTLETTRRTALRAFGLGLVILGFLPSLRAAQFGLFTYQRVGDAIEITGYPRDPVGSVEIPAVVAGPPPPASSTPCAPNNVAEPSPS